MTTNVIENAKSLGRVSKMADASLTGGIISKDEHAEVKNRVRELQLDNLFRAMADFCE